MKLNMSHVDRVVRILVAVAAGALVATGTVGGVLGGVLVAVAIIFLLTGFVGFCPMYALLRLSTRKEPPTS